MKISVAIVEDDQPIRNYWEEVLSEHQATSCAGAFSNAEDALEKISTISPDVVLMDIELPGMDGIRCTQEIRNKYPNTQILVCSVFQDPDRIFGALKAGASGYVLKKMSTEELIDAIIVVHKGGSPMDSQIARRVIESFQPKNRILEELTPRERELLDLLVQGYRNTEIAEKIFVSLETVRTHIRNIYQKLQVNSRVEAVNKYYHGMGR